jgi:hypothetical protein
VKEVPFVEVRTKPAEQVGSALAAVMHWKAPLTDASTVPPVQFGALRATQVKLTPSVEVRTWFALQTGGVAEDIAAELHLNAGGETVVS